MPRSAIRIAPSNWRSSLAMVFSLGLLLAVQPACAEDPEQMRQLLATRQCRQCNLVGAGLSLANLQGADLRGADLRGANLSRVNLSLADLTDANLAGATLLGANLQGAKLDGANLSVVDLRQAYVGGASFRNTNVAGTAMKGAIGLPTDVLRVVDVYNWGVEEGKRNNHVVAIDYFSQAIALDPEMAMAYLSRGVSRSNQGNLSGALEDARKAADLFQKQDNQVAYQTAQELVKRLEDRQNPPGPDFGSQVFQVLGSFMYLFF